MFRLLSKGWIALSLGVSFGACSATLPVHPAPSSIKPGPVRYEPPAVITADLYRDAATNETPLFKFKRTATRVGPETHVLCEFSYPDGKVAVRERVDYRDQALVHFELQELQTDSQGTVTIKRNAADQNQGELVFQYRRDVAHNSSQRSWTEPLTADTLVGDMVGPFLAAHYDKLANGEKVSCRLIVVPRHQTVGFAFKKESERLWRGQKVLLLKMEPSSFLLSTFVDPLYFWVETAPPHRVLQYSGRTTPKVKKGGRWTDLEAVTLFNW
jgi:hypothetical protein